jgi:hypothetical protein
MSDGVFIPVKRESPDKRQHLHTLEGGAWLPFFQSTFTGLIVGFSMLFLAIVFKWDKPGNWGLALGSIAWVITWLTLQRHWLSLTALEKLETLTNTDINGDGVIGAPNTDPVESPTVHISMTDADHHRTILFDLPASDAQMQTLAQGLLNNIPLSERNWTGKGNPFSIQQYTRLRDELILRGLAVQINQKDPRQGYSLTAAGRALMKHYSPTPLFTE